MKTCPVCGKEYPDNSKFCPVDGSTLRAKSPSADLVGQVVADRYAILKKLGEGGMGAVYLGEHVKMGRKSAIKVMNPGMAADPDAISRFNREASNASRISHPNVCQIYDFGETADGLIYLAMEFIEGSALTEIIEREGALPPVRAAKILKQAADALAAAHELGIVHRDLKPDNIMIVQGKDASDVVKVVDFGIAKAVAGDEAGQKVTKTGLVVGTPEYMSPEQLSGDKLDGRSDIYSLALVFYRMLTGVLPFQADSAQETMIKRLTDEPMPLADARPDIAFPPELQTVLDRALKRLPSERYGNAAEFGRDAQRAVASLEGGGAAGAAKTHASSAATQLLDGEAALKRIPTRPKAPPPTAVAPAPAKRSMMVPVLGGFGGVAVLAVVAYLTLGRGKAPAGPSAADTARAGAPAPGATQTAANSKAPVSGPTGSQGARRTAEPNPRSQTTSGGASTAAAPPLVEDSLSAASAKLSANQSGPARATAMFVYNSERSTAMQKARAAKMIAESYLDEDNADDAKTWLRNALRLNPGDTAATAVLQRLGGTP